MLDSASTPSENSHICLHKIYRHSAFKQRAKETKASVRLTIT